MDSLTTRTKLQAEKQQLEKRLWEITKQLKDLTPPDLVTLCRGQNLEAMQAALGWYQEHQQPIVWTNEKGDHALMEAIMHHSDYHDIWISLLLTAGGDPNTIATISIFANPKIPTEYLIIPCNLLIVAIRLGRYQMAQELLKHGANPNIPLHYPDQNIDTYAIEWACTQGNSSLVLNLLAAGAKATTAALLRIISNEASWENKQKIIKMLLTAGADPQQIDPPDFWAALNERFKESSDKKGRQQWQQLLVPFQSLVYQPPTNLPLRPVLQDFLVTVYYWPQQMCLLRAFITVLSPRQLAALIHQLPAFPILHQRLRQGKFRAPEISYNLADPLQRAYLETWFLLEWPLRIRCGKE